MFASGAVTPEEATAPVEGNPTAPAQEFDIFASGIVQPDQADAPPLFDLSTNQSIISDQELEDLEVQQIDQDFGGFAAADFQLASRHARETGQELPKTLAEFRAQRRADDQKEFFTLQSANEKFDTGVNFVQGFGSGLWNLGKSAFNVLTEDIPFAAATAIAGTPEQKIKLLSENAAILTEGFLTNAGDLRGFADNIIGAIGDEFHTEDEEIIREWKRELKNQRFRAEMDKGAIKTAITNNLGSDRLAEIERKAEKAGAVVTVDPNDPEIKDRLLVSQVAGDPLNFTGAGTITKVGQLVGLGNRLQKVGRVPRQLARGAIKQTAKRVGAPLAKLVEKGGELIVKGGVQAQKRGKQAIGATVAVDIVSTGGTATAAAIGTIISGKAAQVVGKQISNFGRKSNIILKAMGDPNRSKRLLDILSTEHGIKTAGLASKLGATQAGDILWNVTMDNVLPLTLTVADGKLQGLDARQVGEAAGTTFGIAAPLSAKFGERGAGASTKLIENGKLTSRAKGSAALAEKQLSNQKRDGLSDFDQAKKFGDLPIEVQAVLGQFAEAGVAPPKVVLLDPKDFQSAIKQLPSRPDITTEFNNGAAYFPNDNVIFLNADGKLTGGDGLRVMGEEMAHAVLSKVIADDPSILHTAASELHAADGRAMPFSKTDINRTVKVKQELSEFVDAYNKAASESGAPRIVTFEQAFQEFYGAQAGLQMSTNQSAFSPATPPWVQAVVHKLRGATLRSMGKNVKATPKAAKTIDQAADTPIGRHVRAEFRKWLQEGESINQVADQAFENITEPKDITTPEKAEAALELDPNIGQVQRTPEGKISRKKKQNPGGLAKLAVEAGGERQAKGKGVKVNGLPEDVKQAWANQHPADIRQAKLDWINQLDADAAVRLVADFYYMTQTGPNASPKPNHRTQVLIGEFLIRENNKIFVQTRDMSVIKKNLNKALNEGRITDVSLAEQQVITDLNRQAIDPSHKVSDQTRAIAGEKDLRGAPLKGDWDGFKPQRAIREFDIEGLMGYGENATGDSAFGVRQGQEGMMFANPNVAARARSGVPAPTRAAPSGSAAGLGVQEEEIAQ